jgi:hypothetical protein
MPRSGARGWLPQAPMRGCVRALRRLLPTPWLARFPTPVCARAAFSAHVELELAKRLSQ